MLAPRHWRHIQLSLLGNCEWRHWREEVPHLTWGRGVKPEAPLGGRFSFWPPSALFWLVWMLFEPHPLKGEGFSQLPLPLSLLAPSSFSGQPVGEGAGQVEEWETLNELSS